VGHLNGFSATRGRNLDKPIFKSSNAREVARGWMLKLRFDWYIRRWTKQQKTNILNLEFPVQILHPTDPGKGHLPCPQEGLLH